MKTTQLKTEILNSITTELKVKNCIPREVNDNVITTYKITPSGIDMSLAYKFRYLGEVTTNRTMELPISYLNENVAILVHFKGQLNVLYPKKYNVLRNSKKTVVEGDYYIINTSEFKKTLEVWLKVSGKGKGFQLTEYLGRSLFVQMKPNLDIYFTEGKYDCYDAEFINSSGVRTLVELKTRDINHTAFDDALFEEGKLYKMKAKMSSRGAGALVYINFYKDKTAVCWNLSLCENIYPTTMKAKYQTYGNTMQVDKRFFKLPIRKGWKEDLKFESTHFNIVEEVKEQIPFSITINEPAQTSMWSTLND